MKKISNLHYWVHLVLILIFFSNNQSAQTVPNVQITNVTKTVQFVNFEFLESNGWIADRYWGCEFDVPLSEDSLVLVVPEFVVQDSILSHIVI